jgi:hypothetical protein
VAKASEVNAPKRKEFPILGGSSASRAAGRPIDERRQRAARLSPLGVRWAQADVVVD